MGFQTRAETSTEVDKNYYEPLKKIMGNGSTSGQNGGNESGIYHDRLPAPLKPIASDAFFTIANHFANIVSDVDETVESPMWSQYKRRMGELKIV